MANVITRNNPANCGYAQRVQIYTNYASLRCESQKSASRLFCLKSSWIEYTATIPTSINKFRVWPEHISCITYLIIILFYCSRGEFIFIDCVTGCGMNSHHDTTLCQSKSIHEWKIWSRQCQLSRSQWKKGLWATCRWALLRHISLRTCSEYG